MPFKIVRNDISKVRADVIVNSANPKPVCGDGTDRAIYEAAGIEKLLAERQQIGEIATGEVAVTGAYDLPAKFVIHTVGPVWKDGTQNELTVLEGCYRKSLKKAVELGGKSIAFPLISTGVYGFPRDLALQTAVSVFSSFLDTDEMDIVLVVYDKKSFQLSQEIVGEIDSYIDANYISRNKKRRSPSRKYMALSYARPEDLHEEFNECKAVCMPTDTRSLEEALEQLGPTFHEKLFQLIDKSGMANKDVWKLANLDRKHFSKIQCDVNYHPKKKTVMALCIALKLDLEQAKDLMARADWAFSPSSKVDLIVQKAIQDRQYDIFQLNLTLFHYTNQVLGS